MALSGITVEEIKALLTAIEVAVEAAGGGTEYAEDAAHVSGDKGTMALAVRADTAAATAANGDYVPLLTDATGKLWVNAGTLSASGYAEDAAHASGDTGTMALAVRADTAAATAANGDYVPLLTDPNGKLWVNAGVSPSTPTVYNVTLTSANTEYSQALPAACCNFEFQCRTAYDVRYAFVTGKVATPTAPYMTLKSGAAYSSPDAYIAAAPTVYFASAQAGVVVEITAWS